MLRNMRVCIDEARTRGSGVLLRAPHPGRISGASSGSRRRVVRGYVRCCRHVDGVDDDRPAGGWPCFRRRRHFNGENCRACAGGDAFRGVRPGAVLAARCLREMRLTVALRRVGMDRGAPVGSRMTAVRKNPGANRKCDDKPRCPLKHAESSPPRAYFSIGCCPTVLSGNIQGCRISSSSGSGTRCGSYSSPATPITSKAELRRGRQVTDPFARSTSRSRRSL